MSEASIPTASPQGALCPTGVALSKRADERPLIACDRVSQ